MRSVCVGLVEQVHREHAEVGEARDQARDAGEQLVEIEHARDLAAQGEERGEAFLV